MEFQCEISDKKERKKERKETINIHDKREYKPKESIPKPCKTKNTFNICIGIEIIFDPTLNWRIPFM